MRLIFTNDFIIKFIGPLLFRTARGNNKGTALSLVAIKENERAAAVEADLKERQGVHGEDVFKPFQFRMEELDGFRYNSDFKF